MSFKEKLQKDLDKIFFNTNEFAETVRIEGVHVPVILDNNQLNKMKQGQILGIVEADLLILAKEKDLPKKKTPGSLLNVNHKEYVVKDWGTDMGMCEIALISSSSY